MKQYIIPHNYKDNGRIFNMFQPKAFMQAIFVFFPLSYIIMNLPFSLNMKLFLVILFAGPPTFAILFGYAEWLGWIIHYSRNKKIYIYGGENLETAFSNNYINTKAANAGSSNRR